ncbi:Gag-Pol polyprotein [Gossypium australe]|uniref:Gag-Pol polyprotein n=1 Tax=Gossypium australe TaxID=47621 RepID=A0A5B6UZR8_9ROSI|nr:Gag-Pol polyprotein [Gossypium australe]
MTVSEYEREFIRLSKYASEWALTEANMCKRFEEELNEDIKLLIGILELREFVELGDQAHKAEELSKEKKQVEREARTFSKRFMGKSQSSVSKKSKKYHDRSTTFMGYSGKERGSQLSNLRSLSPSITSVGIVGNLKPKCKHCNKFYFGECCMRSGAYYRCGSLDHYLKDCPEILEKDTTLTLKLSNLGLRGRPSRHSSNMSGSRGVTKDSTVKSEARAPARTYVICAREDASTPNSFDRLKALLIEAPVLVQLESGKEFVIYNDASLNGLGCLKPREKNYQIHDIELAISVFALKIW